MAEFDDEQTQQPKAEVQIIEASALQVMTEAELNTGVDIARRYKRDLLAVRKETLMIAAADKDTAAECFFSLPRKRKNKDGKMEDTEIEGESIRLAEIILGTWQHMHFGTRILKVDRLGKTITAQGIVHDLQNNTKAAIQEDRNISTSKGDIYSADMINMTGRAASSIALRNATFKVVPKAFLRPIIKEIKLVAIGEKPGYLEDPKNFKKEPLEDRIKKAVKFFTNWGIPEERLFHTLGVKSLEEMTEDHLIKLTGIRSGINQGEFSLTEAFPLTDADKSKDVGQAIVDKLKDKAPQLSPEEMAQKAKEMANAKNNPSLLTPEEIAEGTKKK